MRQSHLLKCNKTFAAAYLLYCDFIFVLIHFSFGLNNKQENIEG